jgi:NAD(P)-dependent dehydrogenase (short-subunit alcohol dehydrogenase family)
VSALAGRHAIVTGANRGIGAATVRTLAGAGASVTLMVRDASRAQQVAAQLQGPHTIVVADLTDREAVRAACADASAQLGPVDILVNNAGSTESAPFLRTPPEVFERMIAIHLLGAVHATQAVLPAMIAREWGRVINVASTAGLGGQPYVTAYVAAKHALVGLTRALALEVSRHGIAVHAVCPGYTETDLVSDAVARISAKTGKPETEALESILAGAAQSRLVKPEEISSAILALCTAADNAPTGQIVVVDGSRR